MAGQPAEEDFDLLMPKGENMAFRMVDVAAADNLSGIREFTMGYRDEANPFERPISVAVGGSFFDKAKGWFFYLGKFEVTESQWAAVMSNPDLATLSGQRDKACPNCPVVNVSWFDVQEFLRRYNLWLFANARDRLPRFDQAIGFVRLPTEAEWEFAARGGTRVEPSIFAAKTPYLGKLGIYEWFDSPASANGGVQQVGQKHANPLGLFDMLGNVEEMVQSPFYLDYLQGRVGGIVRRGGSIDTSEQAMRASLRAEMPLYNRMFRPTAQPTVGIRLVLAIQLFTDPAQIRQLANNWTNLLEHRSVLQPIGLSLAPTSVKTSAKVAKAVDITDEILRQLTMLGTNSGGASAQLGQLKTLFEDINENIRRAEAQSAEAQVRIGSFLSQELGTELKRQSEAAIRLFAEKNPEDQKWLEDRLKVFKENAVSLGNAYAEVLGELGRLQPEVVLREYEAQNQRLKKDSGLEAQRQMTLVFRKHYEEFSKTHRPEPDHWHLQLEQAVSALMNQSKSPQK